MLKDTRKTKAQLIEELDLERQKSARVDLSGAERQLAVERVRVAAMWFSYLPTTTATVWSVPTTARARAGRWKVDSACGT